MALFIYIGWQKNATGLPGKVQGIYIGNDGAAGEAAYEKAISSGKFERGVRVVDPSGTTLPVDPTPTLKTTPTFINPKAKNLPEVGTALPHIQEQEDAVIAHRLSEAEASRASRLAPSEGPKKVKK